MSYYRISRRQAFHFAVSFLASICAVLVYMPKRLFLVDMTKIPGGTDFYPWYYLPVSCNYMTPWKDVYTGSEFCWGLNLLPLILFPFGLACLLAWMWETVHPENRAKPMTMGEKLATTSLAKTTTATKTTAKKPAAKKSTTKKDATKKAPGRPKKAAASSSATKKTVAKKTVKKPATTKATTKKPAAKKTTAKKTTTSKTTAKK